MAAAHFVTTAIADYLIAKENKDSFVSMRSRLAHVVCYLTETDQLELACGAIDEEWIEAFRDWALEVPVRSIATLVRRRIGEERFAQVERMLGHKRSSTSDLYALFDVNVLGRALAATNDIIEEIEALTPGAFSPHRTGIAPERRNEKGAENG